ncbi:hypothetical protein DTO207G8_8520 [Paecilomyces variotii]|nr:hypothetical protein DTO169C6_6721 [Paecilomyces variotii]KAJ9246910.1 hypothetical protein DTO207G8_8520 [Paecilomyces variotii]KAJ9355425.1 hypothetical protein DTO027B9_4182 [Paecilomyces variotii]
MPLVRKRRAQPEPEASEDEASSSSEVGEQTQHDSRRQRRRTGDAQPDDSGDSEASGSEVEAPTMVDVMVKKMVRLALASEYSRQPIRRTDISAKVLGEQGSRRFKAVFDEAQTVLRKRFGMEMVELPGKEKVTISQRRAAQRVEKQSSATKSWILTSTLPPAYRTPTIIPPTKAPSSWTESTYTALYTFIISVISLNGGSLPEQKLDRYLRRTNAEAYTPIDRTERLLQRLCKDGYLVRNREMDGGEEVIEYMVGPRGKIEVGENGVAGLVREVYGRPDPAMLNGNTANAEDKEEMEEFESRLRRSLGLGKQKPENNSGDQAAETQARGQGARRARRRTGDEEPEEDEGDSDD